MARIGSVPVDDWVSGGLGWNQRPGVNRNNFQSILVGWWVVQPGLRDVVRAALLQLVGIRGSCSPSLCKLTLMGVPALPSLACLQLIDFRQIQFLANPDGTFQRLGSGGFGQVRAMQCNVAHDPWPARGCAAAST